MFAILDILIVFFFLRAIDWRHVRCSLWLFNVHFVECAIKACLHVLLENLAGTQGFKQCLRIPNALS